MTMQEFYEYDRQWQEYVDMRSILEKGQLSEIEDEIAEQLIDGDVITKKDAILRMLELSDVKVNDELLSKHVFIPKAEMNQVIYSRVDLAEIKDVLYRQGTPTYESLIERPDVSGLGQEEKENCLKEFETQLEDLKALQAERERELKKLTQIGLETKDKVYEYWKQFKHAIWLKVKQESALKMWQLMRPLNLISSATGISKMDLKKLFEAAKNETSVYNNDLGKPYVKFTSLKTNTPEERAQFLRDINELREETILAKQQQERIDRRKARLMKERDDYLKKSEIENIAAELRKLDIPIEEISFVTGLKEDDLKRYFSFWKNWFTPTSNYPDAT